VFKFEGVIWKIISHVQASLSPLHLLTVDSGEKINYNAPMAWARFERASPASHCTVFDPSWLNTGVGNPPPGLSSLHGSVLVRQSKLFTGLGKICPVPGVIRMVQCRRSCVWSSELMWHFILITLVSPYSPSSTRSSASRRDRTSTHILCIQPRTWDHGPSFHTVKLQYKPGLEQCSRVGDLERGITRHDMVIRWSLAFLYTWSLLVKSGDRQKERKKRKRKTRFAHQFQWPGLDSNEHLLHYTSDPSRNLIYI
jgi:hypothetical protein